MASQFLDRWELRRRAKTAAPAGLSATPEAVTVLAEPEEVLVADPRGAQSPSQMVDQRLLTRMQNGSPGLFTQAAGKPHDIRRIPGARRMSAPAFATPDATPE